MKVRSVFLCLALLSSTCIVLAAETLSFDLVDRKGTKIGSTSYTVAKSKDSTKVHCEVNYIAANAGGAHIFEYRVGKEGFTMSASVSNLEDRSLTSYTPSKARDTLVIENLKGGALVGSRTLTITKPDYLIALSGDMSVWQALLDSADANPHTDKIYTLAISGQNFGVLERIESLHLDSPTEGNGTLSGKPITLKHFVLTLKAGTAHLYTDANGKLMQAEPGPLGNTKYVRTGFVLKSGS